MGKAGIKQTLRTLGRFYDFALPHWKVIVLAIVAMFFYSLTNASFVAFTKPILDAALQQDRVDAMQRQGDAPVPGFVQSEQRVKQWVANLYLIRKTRELIGSGEGQLRRAGYICICILAPLFVIFSFLQTYAERRAVWLVMADVRIALFEKLSAQSLGFFDERRSGDLISRLTNDVSVTHNAVGIIFGDLILNPLKFVSLLFVALYCSWVLTLALAVGFPLVIFVLRRYGVRIRRYGRKSLEKLADVTDAISEMFSGIRVVKAFGMEKEEVEEFRRRNREHLKRAFKLVRSRALATAIPDFVFVAIIGLVLLLANHLLSKRLLDFPAIATFFIASFAMTNPLKHIVRSFNVLQQSLGGIDRIFEVLDFQPDSPDTPDAVELRGVENSVRFEHVWFAYGQKPVLCDISLFVPRGSVCAVVGETGAGKTTMLDLIPRFYDVARGVVAIDGVDVRRIKRESLLRNIAIVGQQPFLFNRTVAENIGYGNRGATAEQVEAAARAANIHEFVSSLSDGYDTLVGERGGRLSGGQRQCITIARAILKDAPILILDEATSSLDSESERLVQAALKNLMKDRTTFVIAHRLSTVRHADRIVVLKGGRIVEQGMHEELLAQHGEYARLYRHQFAEPPLSDEKGVWSAPA